RRRAHRGRVRGIGGGSGGARVKVGADLVIGAEGGRSAVARFTGAGAAHVAPASSAVICRYFRDDAPAGFHWYYAPGSAAGVIPTNGGLACVFAATSAERLRRELDGGAGAGLRRILARGAPQLAGPPRPPPPAPPPPAFPRPDGIPA